MKRRLGKLLSGKKRKDSNAEKAYIYISGCEENKVYIDGDTCYELSERIPGQFCWNEAQEIINMLYPNKRWRLPTIEELKLIYKSKIVEFDSGIYWSSSTYDDNYAWIFDFNLGSRFDYNRYYNFSFVRAIRSFKIL